RVFGPVRALARHVLAVIGVVLAGVLAVFVEVLARVLPVVVPVVPAAVVHVGAPAIAVGPVVVVVVDGGADGDAGREPDEGAGHGRVVIVVLVDDDRGRGRRRLRVDDLGVVHRYVDDLRIGGLDDDHLLALDRAALDGLLGRALQVAGGLALLPQPLDAVEDRSPVYREGAAQLRSPGEVSGHEL